MRVTSGKHVLRLVVATALAGAGLVALGSSPAEAAGVPCERTYSSGPLNVGIPDTGSSVGPIIDVPEDGLVVTDVDVTVNIHHPNVSDLTMMIASGTDAPTLRGFASLFDHRGGTGDNLLGTVFDDAASSPISAGAAPFTGRFKPEAALSALNGFAGGLYQLVVSDTVNTGGAATLNDWSVTFRYATCDLDQDGVEDHADSCLDNPGATASGCPIATRALIARYRHGKFKGSLTSSAPACSASRSVIVWKVRSGPDRRIGTITSGSDGSYRLTRARHRGRYYATSPGLVAAGAAVCPAARSATFRIR